MTDILCKVCDSGRLARTKKYRMSGPVVAIGYIFLVPSIIGIVISLLAFFVNASNNLPNTPSTSIAGGILLLFALASFVGGLLGWILVMKKSVLECSNCKATINAA